MNYFFSKKAIPNYVVWIVTMLPAYFIKFSDLGNSKAIIHYLTVELIIWFVLGVVLTAGIQLAIEKLATKYTLKIRIIYLLLSMLIASVVFYIIFWPLIDVSYEYFMHKQSYHGYFATRIFNWFNWIVWFVSITALDLFEEVKASKIKNIALQATLKDAQLNTLKGQINPHFMFNSLNNIRGLMLEDVPKARYMLTTLSETLRYALTQNTTDAISLSAELDMVKKYVDLCKIQFEDRLEFTLNAEEATLSKEIPPMLLQILVENAIKHGIANLKSGGVVAINTEIEGGDLLIKVINSGKLIAPENTTQLGVNNVKQRLDLLYNNKASFTLKQIKEEVVATIKIPLK
ncbi:sensor histidine kinase [Tenacibaculum sp. M341]|uniref:sensor histidine kinase n=1 Tax=Tenacibaculum sp. M341 TaxID=2530339 RepID=UPI00105073B3|nr:histidine kinase [Tenacibaculum sp. M341]TCI85335.1 histidine kinase [Tenacibaculum sp. M341]